MSSGRRDLQITRIPALAVHVGPAAHRDPESDIFACTTPYGGSKRAASGPRSATRM